MQIEKINFEHIQAVAITLVMAACVVFTIGLMVKKPSPDPEAQAIAQTLESMREAE